VRKAGPRLQKLDLGLWYFIPQLLHCSLGALLAAAA
jgi:hypothetical protein